LIAACGAATTAEEQQLSFANKSIYAVSHLQTTTNQASFYRLIAIFVCILSHSKQKKTALFSSVFRTNLNEHVPENNSLTVFPRIPSASVVLRMSRFLETCPRPQPLFILLHKMRRSL